MAAQSSFGLIVSKDGTTFVRTPDGRWLKPPPGSVIWVDLPALPAKGSTPSGVVTGAGAAELEAELQSYRLTGGPRS